MDRIEKTSKTVTCKVCIVGAGTAGMAAAYALKETMKCPDNNLELVILDINDRLGGTATCGWVQTWIEGVNPPYLEKIWKETFHFSDETIRNSMLSSKFSKNKGENLTVKEAILSDRYEKDMSEYGDTIMQFKGYCVTSAKWNPKLYNGVERLTIESVTAVNQAGEIIEIHAQYFIDSSGDGVLCRMACPIEDEDYFVGEDPYSRFKEDLMKHNENNAKAYDKRSLNEPSLMYELSEMAADDTAILQKIKSVYIEASTNSIIAPKYLSTEGYANKLFCNPMAGLGITGWQVLEMGANNAYNESVKRHVEHWKLVKLTLNQKYVIEQKNKTKDDEIDKIPYRGYTLGQKKCNYTGRFAKMLGIREAYRINCEYMLRQNDLTKTITTETLGDSIACGGHTVDFHVYGTIDSDKVMAFNNTQLSVSGIPYGCIVPKKLNNVLIACRAYGASHIALAARRVNKDMAQLGWAAGFALKQCIENNFSNTREVDIKKIQEETGFIASIHILQDMYKKKQ